MERAQGGALHNGGGGGPVRRVRRLAAAFSLSLALPLGSAGQQHTVTRITDSALRGPAELSIAINPANTDNILVVALAVGVPGGPRVTDYAISSLDGGRTWVTTPAPNPDGRVQGDDAVTFGADGVAYHSYISFDGIRVERPDPAWNGIFVSRSEDGGLSWAEPVAVVDHLNTVEPFEDKPWLITDNVDVSPHRGNLYLAWTRFDVYGSEDPRDSTQIYFSRSEDGGRTFAMPYRISDTGGDAVDGDDTVEGAVPAVGPGGEVYVVWAGPRGLIFDRSTDGGWTFGEDKVLSDMPGGWNFEIEGLERVNGMPVTGVDLSDGPRRGTLYVNWIDERHGDPDVFVMSSPDGGESWSEPVRVNDDRVGNGKDQFFTWMAVDPLDGSVNVLFYHRLGLEGVETRLVLARSTDGGRTFQSHPIEQEPFDLAGDGFFGDYSAIAAYGGMVVPAWTYFTPDAEQALAVAVFRFGDTRF